MSKRGFLFRRKIVPERSEGFTLIELLVTVSIIAILSAIGLVAYSAVLKQGRDSKRQSDLRSIQSALEQYYSDHGYYPQLLGSSAFSGSFYSPFTSSTGIGLGTALSPVKTYINNVPLDPINSLVYFYGYFGMLTQTSTSNDCDNSAALRCSYYCLYANLENSNPGLNGCPTGGALDFAVTPP